MSANDPVKVAAAPTVVEFLALLGSFSNTVFTGDPATLGLRVGPAFEVLLGQAQLLTPGIAAAEVGTINTVMQARLAAIAAPWQALIPKPAA